MDKRQHVLDLVAGHLTFRHRPRLDRLRLLPANEVKQPFGCRHRLALPHSISRATYMQGWSRNDIAAIPSNIEPVAQAFDAVLNFLAGQVEYKMPPAAGSMFERCRQITVPALEIKQTGFAGRPIDIENPNFGRGPCGDPQVIAVPKREIDSAFIAGC